MNTPAHPQYRNFGRVVRRARESMRFSQERLAEHSNLNRSYLGEIERGDVVPSLHAMAKLAGGLGVRLSELIARCEEEVTP